MKFTTLNQSSYKTDNGADIDAENVEFLAPYKHVCDGFYEWECGNCGNKYSSRSCGWSISGQLLECDKCHKKSLLVKTNVDELNQWMGKNITLQELDLQMEKIQKNIDDYILKSSFKYLQDQFEKYKKSQQEYNISQREWECALHNCSQIFNSPK